MRETEGKLSAQNAFVERVRFPNINANASRMYDLSRSVILVNHVNLRSIA